MTEPGTQRIHFAGEELVLLPERAVFWTARRSLMLSDVHFGKSATFRAHGIPVPEGECQLDLDRIARLVSHHQARRLIIIGDFFHSGIPLTESLRAMLLGFRDSLGAAIILVRGNHDPKTNDLLPSCERLDFTHFELVHDPAHASPGRPAISGHLHPQCRIGKVGRKSRLPCFLQTDSLLVLPAFGSFTSGHIMRPIPGQTLYPVTQSAVYQLTGSF
jgi:DNA ligase-associated metallophosphoesterase